MMLLREGIETLAEGPGTCGREEPVHGVGGFQGGAGALVDGGEGRGQGLGTEGEGCEGCQTPAKDGLRPDNISEPKGCIFQVQGHQL